MRGSSSIIVIPNFFSRLIGSGTVDYLDMISSGQVTAILQNRRDNELKLKCV